MSTVHDGRQTVIDTDKQNRKFANPYRNFVRDVVTLHTVRVGEGAIKPNEPVTKEITLANGAAYEISVHRTRASQNVDIGAFEFPRGIRKGRATGGKELSRTKIDPKKG